MLDVPPSISGFSREAEIIATSLYNKLSTGIPWGSVGMINYLGACGVEKERCKRKVGGFSLKVCILLFIYRFISPCFPVSQQLINRIDQFLENKGSQYYMKGIDCIRAFREEAMKVMLMCEYSYLFQIRGMMGLFAW